MEAQPGGYCLLLTRSRQRPVIPFPGSLTENINETGVRLWTGCPTVRTEILTDLRKNTVQGHVRNHAETCSVMNTDAYESYTGLSADCEHNVIDHAECYVQGTGHTNGCEDFWSLLKRAMKGTCVSSEPFHLFRYLDEQAFRFNERGGNDAERFVPGLRGIIGKRLTYVALTGSELPQTC